MAFQLSNQEGVHWLPKPLKKFMLLKSGNTVKTLWISKFKKAFKHTIKYSVTALIKVHSAMIRWLTSSARVV